MFFRLWHLELKELGLEGLSYGDRLLMVRKEF